MGKLTISMGIFNRQSQATVFRWCAWLMLSRTTALLPQGPQAPSFVITHSSTFVNLATGCDFCNFFVFPPGWCWEMLGMLRWSWLDQSFFWRWDQVEIVKSQFQSTFGIMIQPCFHIFFGGWNHPPGNPVLPYQDCYWDTLWQYAGVDCVSVDTSWNICSPMDAGLHEYSKLLTE